MAISFEIEREDGNYEPMLTHGGYVRSQVPIEFLNPRRDARGKILPPQGEVTQISHDRYNGYAVDAYVKTDRTPDGKDSLLVVYGDTQSAVPEKDLTKGIVIFNPSSDFGKPKAMRVTSDARPTFTWPLPKQ